MKRFFCRASLLAAAVVISGAIAFAQAPDTVWSRLYQANSAALSLYEMPDSGFVLGGHIVPVGDTYRDMYIVRTNASGDTLWTSAIGVDGRYEAASCLYPTADGGFILVGNRAEDAPYTSYSDICLIKADQDGQAVWQSIFGTPHESESGGRVLPAIGGGYLVVGVAWNSTTVYDTWLYKTDSLGLLEWPNQLDWPDADYPACICRTPDSCYVLAGRSQSFDAEYDYDAFILKMNSLTGEVWARSYGSPQPYDETAEHICRTSDGGFLTCGYRWPDGSDKDIYVVKTDAAGVVEWTSEIGGTYHDVGWCCIETVDGGYAVAASWYRNNNWQVGLIKYNSIGDTMWTAFWGDPTYGHTPYGLVQTADNGFVVGGMRSEGASTRTFLVKFSAEPGFDGFDRHRFDIDHVVTDQTSAMDTLTISDVSLDGRRIVGLRVTLDTLVHPAVEELTIAIAHDGMEATILTEGDASGTGFSGTVFADAASNMLDNGLAPYTGTYRPNENLSVFSGMDPQGDWIITVTDGAPGNDGTLDSWGISLVTDIVLDVEDPDDQPIADYHLAQCYPNPFNPSTTIRYRLPVRSDVRLEVFNTLGRRIVTLVDESIPAGEHVVTWDGRNEAGEEVAAGVYFYRLRAGGHFETKKMVLLR